MSYKPGMYIYFSGGFIAGLAQSKVEWEEHGMERYNKRDRRREAERESRPNLRVGRYLS